MAHNVQNVTLSLTLPITCHICLGKVRRPVICANNHVFCTVCIELWLKNNNQCPACRVPITPENPCKDIIGGAGENECTFSHSVRKHLRKTRLELLQKEYEEEIESLLEEIEDLKGKNAHLEDQLNESVNPIAMSASSECNCGNKQTGNNDGINNGALEEWSKKLQTYKDRTKKLADDMEKLHEENKRLRNENNAIVRENLRLKTEVDLRSPQKFGRFTVAALQAKVDQYEREMNRLKKALERSDQYIEELEGQVEHLKKSADQIQKEEGLCEVSELADNVTRKGAETEHDFQDIKPEVFLSRDQENCEGNTVVDMENCNSPTSSSDSQPFALNNDQTFMAKETSSYLQKRTCDNLNDSCTMLEESNEKPLNQDKPWEIKTDKPILSKEIALPDCSSPSTSLLSLGSMELNTPNSKPRPFFNQMTMKKPLTYLRKLTFDGFPKNPKPESNGFGKNENSVYADKETASSSWDGCLTNFESKNGTIKKSELEEDNIKFGKPKADGVDPFVFKRLQNPRYDYINHTRTTSETFMDAAYLDKINELDCMMADWESSQSVSHSIVRSPLSKKLSGIQKGSEGEATLPTETSVSLPSGHQSVNGNPQTHKSFLEQTPSIYDTEGQLFGGQSLVQSYNQELKTFKTTPGLIVCNSLSQSKGQALLQTSPFKCPSTEPSCVANTSINNGHAAKRKLGPLCSESPTKSSKH